MKPKYKIGSFMLIVISVVLFACQAKKPAFVLVKKGPQQLDTLIGGQSTVYTYWVYNSGNDTLIIHNSNCSCSCTVPNLSTEAKIAPNDSLKLAVTVTPNVIDTGKLKSVECTFKTNTDSVFHVLTFRYFIKS